MGKGGSTTEVKVPAWLEEAAKRNITRGDKIAPIGSVPLSFGPTVAGFTDSQIAGFDNTSNTASAFGLNAPGAFSMGTPIEYANGVRGYSAAPLFDQKMNAFAEARPGQKSYIDSFFIDPFSGNYGYNATMPIDYSLAFPQTTDTSGNTGGGSDSTTGGVTTGGGTGYTYTPVTTTPDAADVSTAIQPNPDIFDNTPDVIKTSQEVLATDPTNPDYNTAFENVYNWQSEQANNDPYGQSTGYGVTTEILDQTGIENWLPPTPEPATYDGSSERNANVAKILKEQYGWTDQRLTELGYEGYAPDAPKNIVETIVDPIVDVFTPAPTDFANTYEAGYADATANPSGVQIPTDNQSNFADTVLSSNDVSSFLPPTPTETTPTSTSSKVGTDAGDGMVWAKSSNSNALVRVPAPKESSSNNDSSSSDSSSSDCVIATHAVASGAFNPQTKRAAVVWCMNNLHDRWWGEAVRRGYRHLGRKKIEQGKAREHYDEFRRYIDFASGKKRTLRGALTFTLRTTQFFVVGMLNKEA